MALILIIETSTQVCSVALSRNGQLIDLIESTEGQNHARQTAVFAETLLSRNNLTSSQLSAVAVSKGPGSYTGLRIGVSTAKGICYAAGIPLIAIGTLEAMTRYVIDHADQYAVDRSKPTLYCPMIDARRMEVYSMLIGDADLVLKPITAEIIDADFLSSELAANQVVFFGNGAEKCKKVITSPNAVFADSVEASAGHMCELAWHAYTKKHFEDVAYFEPFYLKDFVASLPKKNILG